MIAMRRADPGPRRRRRVTAAALAGLFVVMVAAQQAPYAQVWPGPTPDLTAAVARAQHGSQGPGPAGGRFLATTVRADQLSWFGAARCALSSGCTMLPVDTGDDDAMAQARRQMATSQSNAAEAARVLAGPDALPATLTADLGEVAGASAGLMMSLAFVDALTAGDLTGGRRVAGTGTLTAAGTVGTIGGIPDKVAGAAAAGASVFFAPALQEPAARQAAPAGLTVVGVESAAEALTWLCEHGGTSTACAYLATGAVLE